VYLAEIGLWNVKIENKGTLGPNAFKVRWKCLLLYIQNLVCGNMAVKNVRKVVHVIAPVILKTSVF